MKEVVADSSAPKCTTVGLGASSSGDEITGQPYTPERQVSFSTDGGRCGLVQDGPNSERLYQTQYVILPDLGLS